MYGPLQDGSSVRASNGYLPTDSGAPTSVRAQIQADAGRLRPGGVPVRLCLHCQPPRGIGGWALPSEYGVLCAADNLEEQGSNLLFTASGETRFRVVDVLPASLPARDFGEIFPSVDELVEEYIEESPDGKLYLRGEIEELPPLRGIVHSDRWNKLVRRWSEHIVAIDSLVRASGMGLEDVLPIMEGEFLPYTESGLWSACQSILDGYDDRQQALSSEEASQVIDILESALEDKQAQMDAMRFMMESE